MLLPPHRSTPLLIDEGMCGLALVKLCSFATQGKGSLFYAGAWCGYGFHEDGLKAGMAAAVALGARVPWRAQATCPKISLADSFFLGTFDRFARMAIQLGSLRLILPNGEERLYGSRQWQGPISGEPWSRGKRCTVVCHCDNARDCDRFILQIPAPILAWPGVCRALHSHAACSTTSKCVACVRYITELFISLHE